MGTCQPPYLGPQLPDKCANKFNKLILLIKAFSELFEIDFQILCEFIHAQVFSSNALILRLLHKLGMNGQSLNDRKGPNVGSFIYGCPHG